MDMIKYTSLPISLTESKNLAAPRVHKTENEQQLKKSSVVNGDPIEFIEVLLLQGRKGQLCTKKNLHVFASPRVKENTYTRETYVNITKTGFSG